MRATSSSPWRSCPPSTCWQRDALRRAGSKDPVLCALGLDQAVGEAGAVDVLVRLLSGTVPAQELGWAPYRGVLLEIGDGHAERLMSDESGRRLDYWPRVWAARALAYVGNKEAGSALLTALADDHWRVRMTAAQTIGRIGIEGATPELVECLDDEHSRVVAAAVLALERVGTEDAVAALLRRWATARQRKRAERAVVRIIAR